MKNLAILCLLVVTVTQISCKSEYERIRSSGDPEEIYAKAIEYYDEGESMKAQTLFELIIGLYRGRPELEDIYLKYAYTFYNQGKYVMAAYYFENFSSTFGSSVHREESDFMKAFSYYMMSPNYRLDQQYSQRAIDGFQLFVNMYPTSERVSECNNLIDGMRAKLEQKTMATAELYFNLKQYQAATQTFENLLRDFPETEQAELIRYRMVLSAYLLADNSILDKQEERYGNALKYSDEFLKRYERSQYFKEVQTIQKQSTTKLKELNDGGYQNQSTRAGS